MNKSKERVSKFEENYKEKLEKFEASNKQTVLDKKDVKLMSLNEAKLTKADILRMHVKNGYQLDYRQRRKVYEKIQNTRAMHARKVFLKELNMLGWQFRHKRQQSKSEQPTLSQM